MAKARGKKPEQTSEELKGEITRVARKHFSIHGVSGASLKDIAQEAKVASSLINYHFKDKAGLFKACLETFATSRVDAINRILGEARNKEEMRVRIELFVQEMINGILADPYGFDILDREVRSGNPAIIELFQGTLLKAFNSVVEFFKQAKAKGFIKEELEPLLVASLLFSCACDSARKEILAKRFFNQSFEDVEWRNKFVSHVVCLFMSGVMK